MIAILLALASPTLVCTHEQTGERRPARIIRLGRRDRIALDARQLSRIPRARIASVILPDRQAAWSCMPGPGRRYPLSLD